MIKTYLEITFGGDIFWRNFSISDEKGTAFGIKNSTTLLSRRSRLPSSIWHELKPSVLGYVNNSEFILHHDYEKQRFKDKTKIHGLKINIISHRLVSQHERNARLWSRWISMQPVVHKRVHTGATRLQSAWRLQKRGRWKMEHLQWKRMPHEKVRGFVLAD